MSHIKRICLLGFGEVGQRLAADLAARKAWQLTAFDLKFDQVSSSPRQAVERLSFVKPCATATEGAANCQLIISAVTAAETLAAAQSVRPALEPGCCFLDLNSVSPATRLRAAESVEQHGARYVEAAVMSAIEPNGMASPVLLGGPHAQRWIEPLRALGFSGTKFFSAELGKASATKMCRSILIKGTEALLMESLLAARHYGVELDVLASLGDQLPSLDWLTKSRYMISRSLQHGARRAEEMREVKQTVSEAGIEPLMSDACAKRQAWAARYAAALEQDALPQLLDAVAWMSRQDGQKARESEH